jgi:hypothetical protein
LINVVVPKAVLEIGPQTSRPLLRRSWAAPFSRCCERSGQLDAVALQGRESWQGERHRVGARSKVLDAVLPRAVVDGALQSVTAVRIFSISSGLVASTLTPGSTAPDASLTDPAMTACASAMVGISAAHDQQHQGPPDCAHLSTSQSSNVDVRLGSIYLFFFV